ncbi:hypothetical protein [Aurantiacibacter spongiae]|uniref:hypothetical protein n=1 Tax=Aurantiacibacter spongiae TaxID=2488860 RepID=UPI00131532F0|nr:hypothetical protein [Aurantiacibacter spongiae]
MFDSRFFSSPLGHAALVSIAAMVTFAVFAGIQPDQAGTTVLAGVEMVELA